jgi:hypothetical protein
VIGASAPDAESAFAAAEPQFAEGLLGLRRELLADPALVDRTRENSARFWIAMGITAAVVLVVAALTPEHAWQQPILRLLDTSPPRKHVRMLPARDASRK